MSNDTVTWDTETTGLLSPEIVDLDKQPYIIEIFCNKLNENFEVIDTFHSLVKPVGPDGNAIPISEEITKITGIDNNMVRSAPEFIEIYKPLAEFMQSVNTMVAHNQMFDGTMLINELSRHDLEFKFPWPMNWICTVEASHSINNRRMSLKALYYHITGTYFDGSHRAQADADALTVCYEYLVKEGLI